MMERYTDIEHIERDLAEAKAARDASLEHLKAHARAVMDGDQRSVLLKDAVHDLLRSSRLFKWVAKLLRRWDR